jgi:hypothetical protein
MKMFLLICYVFSFLNLYSNSICEKESNLSLDFQYIQLRDGSMFPIVTAFQELDEREMDTLELQVEQVCSQLDIECMDSLVVCTQEEMQAMIEERIRQSRGDDDFDWGNSAIGGCAIFAGTLCLLLPVPGSRWAAGFLYSVGLSKILENVIDKAEINELEQRLKEFFDE